MSLGKAAARIAAAGTAAGFAAGLWSLAEAQAFALRRRTLVLDPRPSSTGASGEQAAQAASGSATSDREQGDALDRPFSAPAQDAVSLDDGDPRASLDDGDPRRLRILHLSDIHLLAWQRRKLAWIEKLAEESPDMLVLTGDSIAHSAAVAPLLRTLSVFAGLPGIFVFGSNDYYPPRPKNPFTYFKAPSSHSHGGKVRELPWPEMRAGFESFGWIDLNNRRTALTVNGIDVDAVGVDDPHIRLDRFPAARTRPPGSKPRIAIGLVHAPYARALDAMVDDGCSLVFAGHTHGGQVCVPGKGALVTNCDLPTPLVAGLYRWPDAGEVIRHDGAAVATHPGAWVNVSAGLGASPFAPVRLACRPEAIVLDVVLP